MKATFASRKDKPRIKRHSKRLEHFALIKQTDSRVSDLLIQRMSIDLSRASKHMIFPKSPYINDETTDGKELELCLKPHKDGFILDQNDILNL